MIERPAGGDTQPLNTYNVAQLHFALTHEPKSTGIDALAFDVHGLPSLSGAASPAILATPQSDDAEIDDYSTRRMSSSAASDSSLQSRPDKRNFDFSPSTSPAPKKARPDAAPDAQSWSPPQQTALVPDEHHQQQHDRAELSSSGDSPRVQLPSLASTFQDRNELRRASLPTLLSSDSDRVRLPTPGTHRPAQSSSGLASYQFPSADGSDDRRPRLAADTQLGLLPDYSLPSTAISTSSSFSLSGQSPLSGEPSSALESNWAHGIVRPSSTPSQIPGSLASSGVKYDDSLRHSSLGGEGLYGGVTRISGQHHHLNSSSDRSTRNSLSGPAIKTEGDWTFANPDFPLNSGQANMSSPSIAVTGGSPQRSPQAQPPPPLASLVERAPRKRGKLPKPVTDFLKDWLHRHADHPYPSEEEKKALCHATGLSMSQVSNWMINARRRILAPAHRAAQGPTTNNPYNTAAGRQVLDSRRASVAGGEPMSLYYPMSLQNLPDSMSTRQMVGMTRSMSSSHATAGSLSSTGHGHHPYLDSYHSRLSYGSGAALHPSSHVSSSGGAYLGVPLSAPATMSTPNPFLGNPHSAGGGGMYSNSSNGYSGRGMTPDSHTSQARYSFPDTHAHSVSPQPGSGYNTPH